MQHRMIALLSLSLIASCAPVAPKNQPWPVQKCDSLDLCCHDGVRLDCLRDKNYSI